MSARSDDPAGWDGGRWAVGVVDRGQPFLVLRHDAQPSPDHTPTSSNAYSQVQWSYVDGGQEQHPIDRDRLPLDATATIVGGPRAGERIRIGLPDP